MITLIWLFIGVIAAIVFIYTARAQPQRETRMLALGLVTAALIYVGFGLWGGSVQWIGIECIGVAIYGLCAWLGIKRDSIWVAIGWAIHPIWDVGLHLTGQGAEFVPYWYTMLCLSFDLVVASYIVAVRFKRKQRQLNYS